MTIEVGGAAGGLPKLAADLAFPGSRNAGDNASILNGIDTTTGGLVTALSLTGKYVISLIHLNGMPLESVTVKLTVDGVVKWSTPYTNTISANFYLGGHTSFSEASSDTLISCDDSFLLEIESTTGTAVSLRSLVRPLL